MGNALPADKWNFTLAYREHALVLSRSAGEPIEDVRNALSISRDAGTSLEMKTCSLSTNLLN